MQLHFKIENPQDSEKPWLVFVNGLFASLLSWEESVKYFTPYFRVLRYDGRGQGESPRPLIDYSLPRLVKDLEVLLDEQGIESASFIGLSNGGRIALEFASLFPEKVTSVVAADTYEKPSHLLKLKLKSWLEANKVGGPVHRFEVATPWIWGETIVEKRPELLEFYRKRAGIEKVHVIEGLIKGAMEEHTIELNNVHCSTLFLAGEEDLLTPPFSHEKMVESMDNAELKIVPGGHASLLEYPRSLHDVVLPWLMDKVASPEMMAYRNSEALAESI